MKLISDCGDSVARNVNVATITSMVGCGRVFGRSLESGEQFLLVRWQELASVAVKMFPHLIYLTNKLYEVYNLMRFADIML
jgi:hypothetical protein